MPRFLDRHRLPAGVLPAQIMQGQVMQRIKADILSGQSDPFGVRPINVFVGPHEIICLSEAPSPEALVLCHEAKGLHLEHVGIAEVTPLV